MLVVTVTYSDIHREHWSLYLKSTSTHIYSHTLPDTHTWWIEYENVAALAGCVPAVTALMLAAADGSVRAALQRSTDWVEEKEAKISSLQNQTDGDNAEWYMTADTDWGFESVASEQGGSVVEN